MDITTDDDRIFRYTVLGCVPFAIPDESEALEFAHECIGQEFDATDNEYMCAWVELS